MAYIKNEWRNEALDGIPAYRIIGDAAEVIAAKARIELSTPVVERGTRVTAERMNHIEDGIEALNTHAASHAAGGADALTITKAQVSGLGTLSSLNTVNTAQLADGAVTTQKLGFIYPLYDNAGSHNSIYRGKNLGTAVSTAQWAAIAAGTFADMFIGDFWIIGGVTWRIMAFNYYWYTGNYDATLGWALNCSVPHVTLVPDSCLYYARMNATDAVTGAYVGSEMRTTNLNQAKTTIDAAFGAAHILSRRALLTNSVSGNIVNGWGWFDSKVELLSEHQVYGARVWGAPPNNGHGVGTQGGQLPGFALRHDLAHIRDNYWLQDVVTAASFALGFSEGLASPALASTSRGVRPAFSIA